MAVVDGGNLEQFHRGGYYYKRIGLSAAQGLRERGEGEGHPRTSFPTVLEFQNGRIKEGECKQDGKPIKWTCGGEIVYIIFVNLARK